MTRYDPISTIYNDHRDDTGVATMRRYIEALGPAATVLDLGCGTGWPMATSLAHQVAAWVGVDESPEMIAQFSTAVPTATTLTSDMATMDLGSLQFDLCFSWGAICHLQPELQIATLKRVAAHTRPGGRILFTGGPDAGSCNGHVGPHEVHHYSIGQAAYDELMTSLGFSPASGGLVEAGFWLFVYDKNLNTR